jgi:hypothetical protein
MFFTVVEVDFEHTRKSWFVLCLTRRPWLALRDQLPTGNIPVESPAVFELYIEKKRVLFCFQTQKCSRVSEAFFAVVVRALAAVFFRQKRHQAL